MRISRFHLSPAAASTGWGAASTETEMSAQARTRMGMQRTFIVRFRRLEAGGWRLGGDLGPASLLYTDW